MFLNSSFVKVLMHLRLMFVPVLLVFVIILQTPLLVCFSQLHWKSDWLQITIPLVVANFSCLILNVLNNYSGLVKWISCMLSIRLSLLLGIWCKHLLSNGLVGLAFSKHLVCSTSPIIIDSPDNITTKGIVNVFLPLMLHRILWLFKLLLLFRTSLLIIEYGMSFIGSIAACHCQACCISCLSWNRW